MRLYKTGELSFLVHLFLCTFYFFFVFKTLTKFLIEKREKTGLKNLNYRTAFIEHSSTMNEKIEDYNKKRKRKVLIVFDDIISHVMSNKKAQQVLKDLFIRCRKLNISLCF